MPDVQVEVPRRIPQAHERPIPCLIVDADIPKRKSGRFRSLNEMPMEVNVRGALFESAKILHDPSRVGTLTQHVECLLQARVNPLEEWLVVHVPEVLRLV